MTLQRDAQANFYFGSLSARIPSLWISGVSANRSPALAFSSNAAATFPLRCASRPASSSNVSKMAKEEVLNGEPRDRARLSVHQGYGGTQKIRDLLLLSRLRPQRNVQCKFCHHLLPSDEV